ncbi:MAG: DUF1559 domain-containing protein, partial [Gemmataceae bacterium]|nr:DUF1559 domain-containing protein [Gemmataceae bacterium]
GRLTSPWLGSGGAVTPHSFHDTYGFLPPYRIRDRFASWAVLIMPYIEQTNLYNQWDITREYYQQPASVVQAQVPIYYCPTRRSPPQLSVNDDRGDVRSAGQRAWPGGLADYAVSTTSSDVNGNYISYNNMAPGAIIDGSSVVVGGRITSWKGLTTIASIADGTSNTFLVGEKHVRLGFFGIEQSGSGDCSIYNGDQAQCVARSAGPGRQPALSPTRSSLNLFGSYHPGICQFVFCDGSVKAIPVSLNGDILRRLVWRNDGEVIPNF